MKVPISVIVIAKNEEKNLADCLESASGWADEIVLVDDQSTDRTAEIARDYTDKVFTRKMDLEGKQRNFGADQARNDWVMILDCDERLTQEVKKEIEQIMAHPDPAIAGYWVGQQNYIGDYRLRYGGWGAQHIRLYHKKLLRWKEVEYDVVHPGIEIKEGYRGANLNSKLIHYNFKNTEDFIAKVNRQSTLEAIKWYLDGRKMGMGKALWRTIDRFFRRWLGKKGHKDGYYGFVGAVLSGFYQWAAYSKYREIKEKGYYLKEYGVKTKK